MSNPVPEMMEVTLYFHADKYSPGKIQVFTHDMSKQGYPHLGCETVVVGVPECDPVKAEIDMLEKKACEVRQDLGDQLENINRRISELTALEYKPEDSDSE